MSSDNLAVVRRWFEEVWNQRRGEAIDEVLTAASVCHTDDGPMTGPEEFRGRQYVPLLAAFPDLRVEVEDTVSQGEVVVVRWCARGTHSGTGLGPASGRQVCLRGLSWIRVEGGKFAEGWQSSNVAEVLRGLTAGQG